MDLFETLQKKHIDLIDLTETSDVSDDQLFAEVENFIKELKDAGALIADSRQRNQLRTLLRYWGSHLYEQKGEFPDTQLLPVNIDVERETRLEQLYDKARRLFESGQWAEVIQLCQQIIEESPDYKDVQDLLWEAKRELKAGESHPFWMKTAIWMGGLTLLVTLLGVGGWLLGLLPISINPTPSPTVTEIRANSTPIPPDTPPPEASPTLALPTLELGPTATPFVSADDPLDIFSGPGFNYPVVGSVLGNNPIQVKGQDPTGEWLQIVHPSGPGGVGWVLSEFIEMNGQESLPIITLPPPPPSPTPVPSPIADPTEPPFTIPTPLNLLPIEPASIDKIEPVTNLYAHEGPVLQVAFSPDGKLLASSGGDETVRIWSVPNAEFVATLSVSGQIGWVQTGVFSPDGLWLASGGSDRVVRLWDIARRQIFAEFYGHDGFVFSNAFHPDSSLLASSSGDGTVRLWDIGSGRQVAILEGGITEGGISAVYDVAFNPAGTELASGSIDGFVRIWDIATFDKVCEFSTASVLSVAYNPNGDSLASGNTRGHVILLSARCQPERILEGHTDNVNSVAYSSDGQLLASGSRDRLVKVWPLTPTTAEPITLSEHLASVETLTFSPDGLLLVSGSADGKIIFWGIMGN